jgi:streptogramin lyase
VDEEGEVWLANGKRWMFRWVPVADGWREFTQRTTIPINYIADVAVDKDGLVWCPLVGNIEGAQDSPGSRMMVWNALTWNVVGSAALPDSYAAVSSVAIDSLGNRWFGVREGGTRPRGTLLKIASTVGSVVGAGDIEFFAINAPGFAAQTRAVMNVEVGPDNTKWVAVTYEGFAALDALENRNAWGGWSIERQGNEPECFVTEQNTLPTSAIDVAPTPDGRAWCALERSYATVIDPNGTLANRSDDDCSRFTSQNSPMPSNQYTVRADPDGRIWFGSRGGLSRYDPSDDTWKLYTVQNTGGGLPDNRVRAIAFDRQGNAWIGTFGGGLAVLLADGETWLEPWTVESNQRRASGLTTNNITSLSVHVNDEDEEEIWIATWGGGIIRLVKDWSDLPVIEEPAEVPPVYAYPNPYREGEESVGEVSFARAPVGCVIEIYGLAGDRIRSIPGAALETDPDPKWDLKNEDGIGVASGIYVFLVKQQGEVVRTGKLAYLR